MSAPLQPLTQRDAIELRAMIRTVTQPSQEFPLNRNDSLKISDAEDAATIHNEAVPSITTPGPHYGDNDAVRKGSTISQAQTVAGEHLPISPLATHDTSNTVHTVPSSSTVERVVTDDSPEEAARKIKSEFPWAAEIWRGREMMRLADASCV